MGILVVGIAIILCAILYKMGGYGKPFASWQRDWLIPIVVLGTILFFRQPIVWWGWLLYILTIPPTGFALTTYWDEVPFNKGVDNFYMHGFFVGLGAFPLMFVGFHWWMILIRAIVMGGAMGLLCKKFSNVWVEECGRGAIIALTIPLLLI